MASISARKYAASLATVVAITEKMQIVYGEKNGCSELKINLKKVHKKSWEYLKASMKDFEEDDRDKISDVVSKVSAEGLDNTKSWRSLITYMQGLLANRCDELREHNGAQEKIDMVFKLEKMCDPLWDHFASRNRRYDLDEDGVRLMNVFEQQW